jgi:hypothetical protein
VRASKDKQMTAPGRFTRINTSIQVWKTHICFIRPTRPFYKAIGKLKRDLIQRQRAIWQRKDSPDTSYKGTHRVCIQRIL